MAKKGEIEGGVFTAIGIENHACLSGDVSDADECIGSGCPLRRPSPILCGRDRYGGWLGGGGD